MLKECQKKSDKNKSLKLVRGNAKVLPFRENSIDCIVSLNFLHLFSKDEQKSFLDEMMRALKPGGVLICKFNNYYRGIVAVKRTLRKNPTLHLNKITDFKYLFSNPDVKIDEVRGTAIPYVWRIFQYFPIPPINIHKLAHSWPLNLIAPGYLVKVSKCVTE